MIKRSLPVAEYSTNAMRHATNSSPSGLSYGLEGDVGFVDWFRRVTPYINAFRGKTFVLAFSGKMVKGAHIRTLAYDVSLLASLGIRLLLVHGARAQIDRAITARGLQSRYHRGYRITDATTLDCVVDAVGRVYLEIEALLSQGLSNTPMANSQIRVVSGNFITAKPIGILDGVDLQYSGQVRKVDVVGLRTQLSSGNIVMLSCQGYSPSGEIFNLQMEDVAAAAAAALQADKLVYFVDEGGLPDEQGQIISSITAAEGSAAAQQILPQQAELRRTLELALKACAQGVGRVHLVSNQHDGALLHELFTHEGIGTVVTPEPLERIHEADSDDIGAIIALIEPLEESGVLVHRPRELLEREIGCFSVLVHDSMIVGCAALYEHEEKIAELACLAVSSAQRRSGFGERLMHRIETRARQDGIERLFVLTTCAVHWFVERGYHEATLQELPVLKRDLYNYQRRSKILLKRL